MQLKLIEAEFKTLATNFMDGEIDALSCWFEFPLAIYADAKVSVFQDWSALAEYFVFYRAELKARDAISAQANVVATPMMRGNSGTIWMSETYCDANGEEVATSQVRYFFNVLSGSPKIALIEYQQLAAFNSFEDFGVFRAT